MSARPMRQAHWATPQVSVRFTHRLHGPLANASGTIEPAWRDPDAAVGDYEAGSVVEVTEAQAERLVDLRLAAYADDEALKS